MPYFLYLCFMLIISSSVQASGLQNQLANHASPYLAMHGQDPVQWQEWNSATVERARKENKLLFVSSGYFSCHWCHVMQKESYSDKNIASLLNAHFIPVKVDRELNSALDARLIDFVEKTQGIAGWPLNVFITPDGYPLVGMVYVPPDNFLQIISKLKTEWQTNTRELKQMAMDATNELQPAEKGEDAKIPADLVTHYQKAMLHQTFTVADELQGGFGEQNKFPSVPQLKTLLIVFERTQNDRLYKFLRLTLDQMASQGLRDQLDGGFFRYSVDPNWQIPHFEKMLYDNALLSDLYIQAAKILKHREYKEIARETLTFMQQQMYSSGNKGFMASFSAIDNLGIEGGYYVWDSDEVKKTLSAKEWQLVESHWGLQGAADMEQGHHLVQVSSSHQLSRELGWPVKDITQHFQSAKKKLFKQRQKRNLPKDKKILAAWNGLVLSALVSAAKEGLVDIKTVRKLKNYLQTSLWDGKQLYRMKQSSGYRMIGDLEDYAYVAQGLLAWAEWQKREEDWQQLEVLVQQAWKKFYGQQGWKLSESSLLKYREAQTLVIDGPMPSPAAVLIKTSLTLAHHRKNKNLEVQALKALSAGHDTLFENTFWYASYVDALYAHQRFSTSK